MPRPILYLNAQGLTLYRAGPTGLRAAARFSADDAGHAAFRHHLDGETDASPCLVLADLAEEDFQEITVPRLSAPERRTVIARRLERTFPATPYATVLSRAPIPGGRRREDRLLLAALTAPRLLAPWLDALADAGRPVAGLHSAAQLAAPLAARLGLHRLDACLLLTFQDGHLRQTYLVRGSLRLSRLSPLTVPAAQASDPNAVFQAAHREAERLARYLRSQGLWQPKESAPLAACLIAPGTTQPPESPSAKPLHEDVPHPTLLVQLRWLDPALALPCPNGSTPTADLPAALPTLLARHPPAAQFAPPLLRRRYRLWQAGRLLPRLGALTLLLCLSIGLWQWHRAAILEQEGQQLARQAAAAEERYRTGLAALPPAPADRDTLRAVVGRYQALERQSPSFEPLLHALGRALAAAPEIELTRLEWSREVQTGDGGDTPPRQTDAAGTLRAELHGALRPAGDPSPRAAMAAFTAFTRRLAEATGTPPTVLQAPYDLSPGATLRSGSHGESAAPAFALGLEVSAP